MDTALCQCRDSGGTFLWPSLGATDLDFADLRAGAYGGGVVHGPQSDLTTYRGEAMGVMAVMLYTINCLPRGMRVWALCDNESVCDTFNMAPGLRGDYDLRGCDPDVWSVLYKLKEQLGASFRLTWQRSHPELRKAKSAWTRHEHGNAWSDKVADWTMDTFTPAAERLEMGELSWGVSCGGEAVINNVRKSIKAAIQSQCFQRYLTDSRGWGAEVVGPQVAERWRSKLKHMRDLAGATVLHKLMTGWLATLTVQAKRAHGTQCAMGTTCRL